MTIYIVFMDPHDDTSASHVYSDGSFDADLPMQQLSELFNVNHFIVSQANIHAGLLTSLLIPSGVFKWFRFLVSYVRFLKAHVRDWFKNIINLISHSADLPQWGVRRGLIQALLQVQVFTVLFIICLVYNIELKIHAIALH